MKNLFNYIKEMHKHDPESIPLGIAMGLFMYIFYFIILPIFQNI